MILADKIINLRKKAGWSQEDLAEKLGVSRQSVSKWEGAQSVPDMDKVLRLSRIFGVSTDYLLKDEIEECEPSFQSSDGSAEPPLRTVTMEQASAYLELRRVSAPRIALAAFLCVISPAPLIFLAAMSDSRVINISENLACGIGLCALILLAAIGVLLFISAGAKAKEYEFLAKEPFETEYGVAGMLRERKAAFAHTSSRLNIIGTMLCILSVVPIFVSVCFENADFAPAAAVSLTLVIAGIGSAAFVLGGTYNSAIDKLLEEGDYTPCKEGKKRTRKLHIFLLLADCDRGLSADKIRYKGRQSKNIVGHLARCGRYLCRTFGFFECASRCIFKTRQEVKRRKC